MGDWLEQPSRQALADSGGAPRRSHWSLHYGVWDCPLAIRSTVGYKQIAGQDGSSSSNSLCNASNEAQGLCQE